jgi:NADPH-dependent curcumin reductase CurA
MQLLIARASMTGFLVFDFAQRYGEGLSQLAEWRRAGLLHSREDIVRGGLDQFHQVFLRLFHGENTGKLVLQLVD